MLVRLRHLRTYRLNDVPDWRSPPSEVNEGEREVGITAEKWEGFSWKTHRFSEADYPSGRSIPKGNEHVRPESIPGFV